MKKQVKAICAIAIFTLLCLIIPCFYSYSEDVTLDDIAAMEEKLKDIQNKLEENEKALAEIKNQQSFTESTIAYSLSLIDGYTSYCLTLGALISEYNTEIEAIENEIVVKQAEFDGIYDIYLNRLQYMREENHITIIDLILNSDSMADFITSLERAREAIAYDNRLMTDINKIKNELNKKSEELTILAEGKQSQIDHFEEIKSDIKKRVDELTNELLELDIDLSETEAKKDLYEKMEEQANLEIEELIKKYTEQNKNVPSYASGEKIHWPLDSKYTYISSPYGYRTHPITGEKYSFHRAIDLPAPEGEEIYSIYSGVVITATYNSSYGNYVIVDHGVLGNGEHLYSLYAHAVKLNVKKDDEVKIGDVLAYVGETGSAKGDHLHIEIRVGSDAKDPMKYLKKP